jgi:hypothetical protein
MGWLIAAAVVMVVLASPWFVADSRDGRDWKPLRRSGVFGSGNGVRPLSRSPGALAARRGAKRLFRL